jgi:hypothetical protein
MYHVMNRLTLAVRRAHLRKGFSGLHALAAERLGEDPRQGALFIVDDCIEEVRIEIINAKIGHDRYAAQS